MISDRQLDLNFEPAFQEYSDNNESIMVVCIPQSSDKISFIHFSVFFAKQMSIFKPLIRRWNKKIIIEILVNNFILDQTIQVIFLTQEIKNERCWQSIHSFSIKSLPW